MNPSLPIRNGFCRDFRRRELLTTAAGGFAHLALAGMLAREGFGATPQAQTHVAKAKSVIFLFMYGGPSHIDSFDYKPDLIGKDGMTIRIETKGRGGSKTEGRIVEPRWKFHQRGQSGKWVSDLFPNIATCVDDIAFVHSLIAESPLHGSAMLKMNTGSILSGKPSLGAWINYGLGSVNQDLPGYVGEELDLRVHACKVPRHGVPFLRISHPRPRPERGDDRNATADAHPLLE